MGKQKFGGKWTIEKLSILTDYLNFYVTALKDKPFELLYIDAFAGSGNVLIGEERQIEGSASLALGCNIPFSKYVFVEKDNKNAQELEKMVESKFPELKSRVQIVVGDCNEKLIDIINAADWRKTRAVLFLDPYATAVKYETLQKISLTQAIDVWYLFPFMAARRLMPNDVTVYDTYASWKKKLDDLFGTEDWYENFYQESNQLSLFDNVEIENNVSEETLKTYIIERLKAVFPNVAPYPRMLYNATNSPLFLFCFAVSNPDKRAYDLALKVANHILNKDFSN